MMRLAIPRMSAVLVFGLGLGLAPVALSACSSSETAEPNGTGPGVGAGGTGGSAGHGVAGAAGDAGGGVGAAAGAGTGGVGGGSAGAAGMGGAAGHGGMAGAGGAAGGGGSAGEAGTGGGTGGGNDGGSGGSGGAEPCVPGQDIDLDTFDDCADCDDTNGSVHPGAVEFCDGVDQDCDGAIDNGFDVDGDHYSACHPDPLLRDCNDSIATVNPGADEACGGNGLGNGLDDDCDGYVDEGCVCNAVDADDDGVSTCDGDCDDNDPERTPGKPEVCDGKDNDCNRYTRLSCTTGDACNFDADQNDANDPDLCMTDMYCVCTVDSNGDCITPYGCSAYCNASFTGPIEDGVGPDEICNRTVIAGANSHMSSVATETPGTSLAGDTCSLNTDCRSLWCVELCPTCGSYCMDLCASDDYCGPNARCEIWRDAGVPVFEGYCMPPAYLGANGVGTSCAADGACDHNYCMSNPDAPGKYCTEPCCQDTDCPAGYTCSLRGGYDEVAVVGHEWWSLGVACNDPSDCVGKGESCHDNECAWRAAETVPMCILDVPAQGDRTAGQACSANVDCESNFCERSLGVCVEICCADATCPHGLTCEGQWVELDADHATYARVCMNNSVAHVLQPK